MTIDSRGIIAALSSHAQELGVFNVVTTHEPKRMPEEFTAAFWVDEIIPIQSSGLDKVSIRLAIICRIYTGMLQEPADDIDTNLSNAVDLLMEAYCGGFTLGGSARSIDVFGSDGEGLNARYGYIRVDTTLYRMANITIPVIVNDAWTEVA